MTRYIILILANAYTHEPIAGPPCYLKTYDVEARDGRGVSVFTTDKRDAMRFDSLRDALACWKQSPKCRPWRNDGKHNRPLTAYTVEILTDDAEPLRLQ
jgi:hypothetical protein